MSQYIDILKHISTAYWGGSIAYYGFILALVVVFFNTRDAKKKSVFFWLPVLLYLALISPVGIIFGNKFLGADMVAYMCRLISFVPIFYVMAYACVLIADKFSGWKKLFCVIGLCTSIMLCGSKLIYINDGYRFVRSENAYKIPTDLMTICDYMDGVDEDPVVALNTGLSYMARQYDPSLHLLAGARMHGMKLSDELGSDEPDAAYIMQTTCGLAGDFVIVNNKDSVREAFSGAGFRPCFETPSLLLYESGGYPGARLTYNEIEQVVRRDYYDETGKLCLTEEGVASAEYSYDEFGRVVEEHYSGLDGKPVLSARGFSAISYVWDERGNIVEEHYMDAKDQPIALEDGYAGVHREFDENNRVVRLTYLDSAAKPILNVDGVASVSYDYENELGTLELYYDVDGNPIENSNGCYGVINGYGSNGCVAYQIFVDKNGKLVETNAGYAKATYMYDCSNRLIRVSFYDVDDNPVECTDGYAGYRRSYGEDGEYTDVYFGLDGECL